MFASLQFESIQYPCSVCVCVHLGSCVVSMVSYKACLRNFPSLNHSCRADHTRTRQVDGRMHSCLARTSTGSWEISLAQSVVGRTIATLTPRYKMRSSVVSKISVSSAGVIVNVDGVLTRRHKSQLCGRQMPSLLNATPVNTNRLPNMRIC
jgi:hypothetical protein